MKTPTWLNAVVGAIAGTVVGMGLALGLASLVIHYDKAKGSQDVQAYGGGLLAIAMVLLGGFLGFVIGLVTPIIVAARQKKNTPRSYKSRLITANVDVRKNMKRRIMLVLALVFLIASPAFYLLDTQRRQTNLNYAAWRCSNLRNSKWPSVYLRKPRLANKDFSGACLQNTVFDGGDFTGAKFVGADLRGTKFIACILHKADFRNADLRNAKLRYSSLRDADLRDARIENADFSSTELFGADLRGAKLLKVEFAPATAGNDTQWPKDFNLDENGIFIMEPRPPMKYGGR